MLIFFVTFNLTLICSSVGLGSHLCRVRSLTQDPSLIWNTVGAYWLIQSVTLFTPAGYFNFYWNLCLQNYDIQQKIEVLTIDNADTQCTVVQLGVKHVTFQSVEWCTSNQPGAAEMIDFRPYKDWHHSKTKISYLRHHQNSGILRNNLLQVLCPSQILHHWPKKWQKSNAMYLNKVSQYHTL